MKFQVRTQDGHWLAVHTEVGGSEPARVVVEEEAPPPPSIEPEDDPES